jgi:hypothetical protein
LWEVGDTLTSSYAQDTTVLRDSGLLPPKLLTRLNTASSALRYDLSPRSQIRWLLTEQDVSFVSSQFRAASTFTTGVNVARQLSRSQTVGVTEEYQRTATRGGTGVQDSLLGTWQRTIGKNATVTATGGIRLYTLYGGTGFHSAPGGSIAFTARLRHDDSLGLRYERLIEQALGDATHFGDEVWAGYVLSLSNRLAIEASGNYDRGTFPLDPNHQRNAQTGTIATRFTLVRNLAVGVAYGLYTRVDTPTPAVSGYRATMSLIYGQTWR